ncbi:FecR domain-containing protein [Parabacteroides sp. OttesenSCG-928-G06]|nr:FecR domain-containing protein [Parabacteroides sp. OttesenSCG-928-G06]
MLKKYQKYRIEEFLSDDYFLSTELHPTEESRRHWDEVTRLYPELAVEIEKARDFLRRVNLTNQTDLLPKAEEVELWQRIQQTNRQRVFRRWISASLVAGAAAALALFLILNTRGPAPAQTDYTALIESARQSGNDSENIQLVLSDDNKLSLQGKDSEISYDEKGEILVNSEKIEVAETTVMQYNTLIVPMAKRSSLLLSDGTKIWVNSDSKVVYPTTFDNKRREIYVEGEVFLDVAPDKKRPFVVKTKNTETTVLGTRFNVTAYPEEIHTDIVLVEGSVEVQLYKEKTTLSPNQLLRYNPIREDIEVKAVDVANYTAWIDGYYQFRHLPMDELFRKVSKYYGVKMEWNPKLNTMTCSGKLDLKDDPSAVFVTLEKAAPIRIVPKEDYIQVELK